MVPIDLIYSQDFGVSPILIDGYVCYCHLRRGSCSRHGMNDIAEDVVVDVWRVCMEVVVVWAPGRIANGDGFCRFRGWSYAGSKCGARC